MKDFKAFKRITVEFSHEVDGQRKSDTIDFVRGCNGVAYGQGAMEIHVGAVLVQMGLVKPKVVRIDSRLSEPPLIFLS